MITYCTEKISVDWNEAVLVFHHAPLGKRKRDAERLKRAFESSYAVVFVFDSDKLIGLGRALCDGEYQAAIYDVVLLPEYQGKGIGKEIVRRLCDQLPVENIILYSVPGREAFYEKCGFRKMRTAMGMLNQQMTRYDAGYLLPHEKRWIRDS
jgi:GNAT superfamily N-acetyltransferase